MAAIMRIAVFWNVVPCVLVVTYTPEEGFLSDFRVEE
jgi:hypothetical protein